MKSAIVALFIAGVFFSCAWFSLGTRLSEDDVMNMTFAWEPPWTLLALGLAVPFTPFYRPAGALLYRSLYDLFGVNFLPFRIVIMILLIANIYLVYRLGRRLSRSAEIGALSALIFCFHGRMQDIYRNTGTLYDVLCATLSLSTLLWYVSLRLRGRTVQGWDWLKLLALFIAALNAKEMAGAIPIIFLVFEGIWFRRLTVKTAAPALVTGLLTALTAHARTGPGTALGTPDYRMTFTAHQFLSHWGEILNAMLYGREPGLNAWEVALIFLVLIAVAWIARRKHLWLFLAIAFIAPLPVIFIPWRGFFVMYLPWAGWAMYLGTVLVEGRNWLWSHVWRRPPLPPNPFEPERLFLFLTIAGLIIFLPRLHPVPGGYYESSQRYIRVMKNDLVALHCPLPGNARILFLHDPFPADSYTPLQLARLVYRDRTLTLDRPVMLKNPPEVASYDAVFDYQASHLVIVRGRPATRSPLLWPGS